MIILVDKEAATFIVLQSFCTIVHVFRTQTSPPFDGTKIQDTLINKHIETWKVSLKPIKIYYIAKGRLDHVNPNYSSVHKEVKLAFIDNTIIEETNHKFSTLKFFDGFVSLDHAENYLMGLF